MNSIKKIVQNKWFKFIAVSLVYILWFVVWAQIWWSIIGVLVIYDIYISKYLYKWIGARHQKRKETSRAYKSTMGWIEAIVFAVVVASLFRIFFFEMYVIPTPSMEKTLLVGDYLAVSKVSYGPKLPNTPLSFPLVHNTMPFSSTRPSFVDWIQRPYKRIAGLGRIRRHDVVVFNFPEGDTVAMISPTDDYYRLVRVYGREEILRNSPITVRPVDKKDNYIKRTIAIAGDTLRIIDNIVYVNGQKEPDIPQKQFNYLIKTNGTSISANFLERNGISKSDIYIVGNMDYIMPLTSENAQKVRALNNVVSVNLAPVQDHNPDIFPHKPADFPWTESNFGPLWIPRKGATVQLTPENLPLYERVIRVYEKNELTVQDGVIRINGQKADAYTFKMDYYFMMGDNRNNSMDSRYWGFVPEDHVVGKAKFIWMSIDKEKRFPANIRFERIARSIR